MTLTSPESHPLFEIFDEKSGVVELAASDFRVGFEVTGFNVGAFVGLLLGLRVGFEDGMALIPKSMETSLLFELEDLHLLFDPHFPEQQNTSSPPALKQSSPSGWQLLTIPEFLLLLLSIGKLLHGW